MNQKKIRRSLKISQYILEILLWVSWFIVMFLPEYIWVKGYVIFFTVHIICSIIHIFLKRKYLPDEPVSGLEKVTAVILVGMLLIKEMFLS